MHLLHRNDAKGTEQITTAILRFHIFVSISEAVPVPLQATADEITADMHDKLLYGTA